MRTKLHGPRHSVLIAQHSVLCFAVSTLLFALCASAEAQQSKKIPRIGYIATVGTESRNPNFEAFRRGLLDLGYIEGESVLIEHRAVEGKVDRIPSFVAELIQLKVDVLVSPISAAIRAAKQATKTIPIVMVTTQDAVAAGFIDSLAHPGGNITGVTRFTRELSGKRLELLTDVVPRISRVGILGIANPTEPAARYYEAAASTLKIQLRSLEVRDTNPDFEAAFRDAAKQRVNALITVTTPLFVRQAKQITDLTIKNRLPSMFEGSEYVEAGGLMSYSGNDVETFRRAAYYVDKIFKGAKPSDLPVEQPTKFEFVINLKAAKQIGLTIPPNVLARADRVIR
jgi:ABC-type uncharacterized transport system substrate-binding protein